MSKLSILICLFSLMMGIMSHARKVMPKELKARRVLSESMHSVIQSGQDPECNCDHSGPFSMGCDHDYSYESSGNYWYYGDKGSMDFSASYEHPTEQPAFFPTLVLPGQETQAPNSPEDPTDPPTGSTLSTTSRPTTAPSTAPSIQEKEATTENPTVPTDNPSEAPTKAPNTVITDHPSLDVPTSTTTTPSEAPTEAPNMADPPSLDVPKSTTTTPSEAPTEAPFISPTSPTNATSVSQPPTQSPNVAETEMPVSPSASPTEAPTFAPSELVLTGTPTIQPTLGPTIAVTLPNGQIQLVIILIIINLPIEQANSVEFQNLILSIISSLLSLSVQFLSINNISLIGGSTRRLGENQLAVSVGVKLDTASAPVMLNLLAEIIHSGKLSQQFQQSVEGTPFQGANLVTSQASVSPVTNPTNPPSSDNSDSSSSKSKDSSNSNMMMGILIGCGILVGAVFIGWYTHRSGMFAKNKKLETTSEGDDDSTHHSVELDLPTIFKDNMDEGYFVQRGHGDRHGDGESGSWCKSFYGKSSSHGLSTHGIFLKRESGRSTSDSTNTNSERYQSMELDVDLTRVTEDFDVNEEV